MLKKIYNVALTQEVPGREYDKSQNIYVDAKSFADAVARVEAEVGDEWQVSGVYFEDSFLLSGKK